MVITSYPFLYYRGVVLYAMVCGILPFGDNQIHRLIAKKEVALQFKSPHTLSTGTISSIECPLKQ